MALNNKTQLNYVGGVSQLTDVNKMNNQAKEQINNLISLKSGGIIKRNPLELFSELDYIKNNAYMYTIDRSESEKYIIIILENGMVLAFDKDGKPFPVVLKGNSQDYLITKNPKNDIKHVIVNDTTYLLNKSLKASFRKDLTPPDYNQGIVWLKNVDYGKTFEILVNGDVVATHKTPDGKDQAQVDQVNTDVVAADLLAQLKNNLPNFTFDIVNGSVILLSNNELEQEWVLETKDGMGGAGLSVIKDKIKSDSELPSQAFEGFKIMVDGDPTSDEGNYYYKFNVNGSETKGDGVWEETIAEKILFNVNQASMPHKLISYPDRFELVEETWINRLVGDDTTNPAPTFFDKNINDIFLFSNRLGFLSGDSIILSEHDVYNNFFKSSVRATLETDYIDVSCSTTEINVLRHAVLFNNELVVNSDRNFFSLSFSGNNISNANASLRNFGHYETNPNVSPKKLGTSIYYLNNVNENTRMFELYVNNYNSADIRESSFMIPNYMPYDIDTFYCKPDNNIFLLNKSGDNNIYIYQDIKQNGQSIINAFHRWQVEEGAEIIGVSDLDKNLIILMNYKGFTRVYTLNLSETKKDPNFTYVNYLDFKQNNENVEMVYNNNRTEITMNNLLNEKLLTVIITEDFNDLKKGESFNCSGSLNNTYYFDVDLTNAKFIIGETYNQLYTHGIFYPTGYDGVNKTQGTTMLSFQEIFFENTGYFEIDIKYKNRRDRVQTIKQGIIYNGKNNSDNLNKQNLITGSRKFGITGKNDEVEITIRNDSHLPCNLIRCDYLYRYWSRT